MRIPKSVDVYGSRWSVGYKWNLLSDKGEHVDGLCDKKNRTILIDRSLSKDERPGTFFHELFHAIIYELKLGQTDLSGEVEEVLVEGISDYMIKYFILRLRDKAKII